MSILIKGMSMPKSCAECFVAWERCHRTVEWYKNNPQYYDIRHEDCPLIELPPHGDLIDRDSVLEILSDKNAAWDGYVKVKALPVVVESEEKDG